MSTNKMPWDITQRLVEAVRVNEVIDKLILVKLLTRHQQETASLCDNLPSELCLAIQKWEEGFYQSGNLIILIDREFVFIAINGFDKIWRGLRCTLTKDFGVEYNKTSPIPVSFGLSPTNEIVNLKTETWYEWIDTELRPHLKPLKLSLNELRRRPTWYEQVNENLPVLISQLTNRLISRHRKLEDEYIK